MDLGLKGKVAVVTGGSKGIGEAITRTLLTEGAQVANINRSTAEGESLEAEYQAKGQRCKFIQADLTQIQACERAVKTALDEFGRIDILINNAGVNDGVSLSDGPDAFLGSLQRNLIHYYAMAHYALNALKESQGAIINVSSKVAATGQGGTSGYAASKGGINGMTREWALDLAADNIRVNTVVPAETWTPLYAELIDQSADPAAARKQIEDIIPLGKRFTTSQEIADMVVFLASQRSLHTTGQIHYVDGGYTHLDRKYTSGSNKVDLSK
ncbi:MAG: short-chain dehydrogenase [Planctomycetaceae bacterium]|nr:short-chain dehydrogenase [Planctomycetaceae bacterium]|tara:strand:- start:1103 stop:1912 length:810 start_codon:yes stop_codon:yes gene_type:complete